VTEPVPDAVEEKQVGEGMCGERLELCLIGTFNFQDVM